MSKENGLQGQRDPRKLPAAGHFAKRVEVFASVRSKQKLHTIKALFVDHKARGPRQGCTRRLAGAFRA